MFSSFIKGWGVVCSGTLPSQGLQTYFYQIRESLLCKSLKIDFHNEEIYFFAFHQKLRSRLSFFMFDSQPSLLMTDKTITKICCGGFHSLLHKKDGDLLVGKNDSGQLGFPNRYNQLTPKSLMKEPKLKQISAGYNHNLITWRWQSLRLWKKYCRPIGYAW